MAKDRKSLPDADWYICPSCGAEVRVGSDGCRTCGPGIREEWAQDDYLDGVDLPDDPDEFDHKAFVKKEFGIASRFKPCGLRWYWWLTGLVVVGAMIAGFVRW